MTRFINQSLAVFAAVILTITSVGAITTVPPASASTAHGSLVSAELA
ncbi:hypothetical protein NAP1_11733 [Erythrobacter sp. NAP1]|nr:hypothetical protein [Erythrobacter sp. NAP1]EAQ28264.1 hypothetical protein NAP1_11733 [Erythrobacter sp. NAP1]